MNRRDVLQTGTLVLLLGAQHLARGATIVAVRVWPSKDYTRLTIESDGEIKARQFLIAEPPRLAVDIEGIDLIPALRELIAKVKSDDPNISGIRVGQNAPGVVRLVIDLKQPILPQVFTLPPVAAYQYRLVFDLYPAQVADPLEALIAERLSDNKATAPASAQVAPVAPAATDALGELMARQSGKPASSAAPPPPGKAAAAKPPTVAALPPAGKTDRLIIVALDPGHGPGRHARKRRGAANCAAPGKPHQPAAQHARLLNA
jgi:N-acetylmuramoyl-L-alanine amidase